MNKTIMEAEYFGTLDIGGILIKCAVLNDGTRVLTRSDFIKAIGRTGKAKGGRAYDEGFKTPVFLTANNLKPFIPNDLDEDSKPILFKYKDNEHIGYKAELLPKVCSIFLDAEKELKDSQVHIAQKCKILLKGFALVGINALVDEATGFQDVRDRMALQKILEKYLSDEKLAWAKKFPNEFYEQLFRLRGWQWKGMSVNRPQYVGRLTNDVVYERLAPGVLEELKKRTPKDKKGNTKFRMHQWLTDDFGNPKLVQHLYAVVALMKASNNWDQFKRSLERAFPKCGDQLTITQFDNN